MQQIHIDTKTLAGIIVVFTLLVNVGLQYFNISGTFSCELARANPEVQAAAAAAINR